MRNYVKSGLTKKNKYYQYMITSYITKIQIQMYLLMILNTIGYIYIIRNLQLLNYSWFIMISNLKRNNN